MSKNKPLANYGQQMKDRNFSIKDKINHGNKINDYIDDDGTELLGSDDDGAELLG
jgi:hypothetical protein